MSNLINLVTETYDASSSQKDIANKFGPCAMHVSTLENDCTDLEANVLTFATKLSELRTERSQLQSQISHIRKSILTYNKTRENFLRVSNKINRTQEEDQFLRGFTPGNLNYSTT